MIGEIDFFPVPGVPVTRTREESAALWFEERRKVGTKDGSEIGGEKEVPYRNEYQREEDRDPEDKPQEPHDDILELRALPQLGDELLRLEVGQDL
jgi:hypothetical protein